MEIIELLIEKRANINTQNIWGNTPLHQAVINYNLKMVKKLSSYTNIQLDIENRDKETPLQLAKILLNQDSSKKNHNNMLEIVSELEKKSNPANSVDINSF